MACNMDARSGDLPGQYLSRYPELISCAIKRRNCNGTTGHLRMDCERHHAAVMAALTRRRLRPYLQKASGDPVQALELYGEELLWSSRLIMALHVLEIVLRNRVASLLGRTFGKRWYLPESGILRDMQLEQIRQAMQRRGRPGDPLLKVSFGFWSSLFSGRYDHDPGMWRRCLWQVFSHAPENLSRKAAYGRLEELRQVRNRVAHHERVRAPEREQEKCLETIGWLCPETEKWTRALVERLT